jgi:hypothetical protein
VTGIGPAGRPGRIRGTCPFDRCHAGIEVEQKQVLDEPPRWVARVSEHVFVGEGLTGRCPASSAAFPLTAQARQYLREVAQEIDRRARERIIRKNERRGGDGARGQNQGFYPREDWGQNGNSR